MVENIIKAFNTSNVLIETNLRRLQEDFEIDLGKTERLRKRPFADIKLKFRMDIRRDAEIMARYYAIFYCIERQTREVVGDVLEDAADSSWWNSLVPEPIRNEVNSRIRKEMEAGVALRSIQPIDYTTFGELAVIIEANWHYFDDFFENRKATKRALSQLNLLRGPIAHNSTFVENEAHRFNLAIEDWLRQQKISS